MEQLIIQVAAAFNMRTLYPPNHPRVIVGIEQIIDALKRALEASRAGSITFLIVGEDLVVDDQILRKTSLSQQQFIEILRRRGIERLTIAAGIDAAEVDDLV